MPKQILGFAKTKRAKKVKSGTFFETWSGTLALGGAVLALTISPLFVRWADAPGVVTSLYRMLIAAFFLSPFAAQHVLKLNNTNKKDLLFPVMAGFFSAVDHGLWASAIENTTIANATLLNNISPLWVALFAMLVWRERFQLRFWVGLVSVMIGASAVLGSTIVFRPQFFQGDAYALASSAFYAAFFLASQRGRRSLSTVVFLWVMLLSAGLFLFLFVALSGYAVLGYSTTTYLIFLAAGLVSQLVGYFLMVYALGKLPASVVTPSMVAQPVLTALIAIPLLGEKLLTWQILGGLMTLAGIWLVNATKRLPNDDKQFVRD